MKSTYMTKDKKESIQFSKKKNSPVTLNISNLYQVSEISKIMKYLHYLQKWVSEHHSIKTSIISKLLFLSLDQMYFMHVILPKI